MPPDRPWAAMRMARSRTSQGKVFNTAEWYDYLIGFTVSAVLSGIASVLLSLLSFIGFFMFFLLLTAAPIVGAIIASAVQASVRKHRSKSLFIAAAVGVVIGAVPISLFLLLTKSIFGLIAIGIYIVIAAPMVYARLSGIEFRR